MIHCVIPQWSFEICLSGLTNHSHSVKITRWNTATLKFLDISYTCLWYGAITPISVTDTAVFSFLARWQQYCITWTASVGLNHEGLWPSRVSLPCIRGKEKRMKSRCRSDYVFTNRFSLYILNAKKDWCNAMYDLFSSLYTLPNEKILPSILYIFNHFFF